MVSKIILHNSISLDGSLLNFDVNMQLHYQIAAGYKPDAHLIGSNTIKMGIELYGNLSKEEENDFIKPKRENNLPYWIIPDTTGSLKGLLHEIRRFEFCKDLIILISKHTPDNYIKYLKDRDYDFLNTGNVKTDLEKSFKILNKNYNINTILTDTGKILGNILINKGLVNEISLLIHPVIVGDKSYPIFDNINQNIKLKLVKNQILEDIYIWMAYKVESAKK